MMTDLRTAAQQALEAMLNFPDDIPDEMFESITALKAALAQKHDPVAHSGWVLREVLFDNGEPIGHREPQHSPAALAQQAEQQPMHPELRKMWEDHFDKCFRAIPVPEPAEPDWQDLYLKEKQRADMWRDKYESVAGAEQRIYLQAEPVEPVRLQCVTCGTVYADGVPPQVPVQQAEPVEPVQEPVQCEPQYANEDGWCEWVCPNPTGYLMQCCDCGLIHEVDSRVAKYQPRPSEEFEVVDDPDLQVQWRMKRRDDISPKRKPLTEDEIALIVADCSASAHRQDDFHFARAIERAHGIGGQP